MSVTVGKWRKGATGEYIGRAMPRQGLKGSPLGNPYRLDKGVDRSVPIAQYRDWLKWELQKDSPARTELDRLTELARAGDLVLLCWCAPLSCHGDVIKATIEQRLAAHP